MKSSDGLDDLPNSPAARKLVKKPPKEFNVQKGSQVRGTGRRPQSALQSRNGHHLESTDMPFNIGFGDRKSFAQKSLFLVKV